MKKAAVWFLMLQKRILKKRMFQITLLMIPILIFILYAFSFGNGSMVEVALFSEGENNSFSQAFVDHLIENSSGAVTYYRCDSKEELYQDVQIGRAESGYILPKDLQDAIVQFADGNLSELPYEKGGIRAIHGQTSLTARLTDEMVFGAVYPYYAYYVSLNFLEEKQPAYMEKNEMRELLKEHYEGYRQNKLMFEFEYADGTENQLLNNAEHVNYYMMPMRGMLSLLVLVAGMGGILMYGKDELSGCFQWISGTGRLLFSYFYLLMPVFLIGLVSLIGIFLTGLTGGVWQETLAMFAYILLVTGFCNLIRLFFKNVHFIAALMPLLVLISLVICPVFINISSLAPGVETVRAFLPTSYYLNGIYDAESRAALAITAVLISLGSLALDWMKDYFLTRPVHKTGIKPF